MATRSSILAWRIPGTEEPGGLQSVGSQRVRHDQSDLACSSQFKYFLPQFIMQTSPAQHHLMYVLAEKHKIFM